MMEYKYSINHLLELLKREKIRTWFDLGLFIDRFREQGSIPPVSFDGSYNEFINKLSASGMAFITFHFAVDGVTVEVQKYAELFKKIIPGINIHYVAGQFFADSEQLIDKKEHRYEYELLKGFDDWPLYQDFYFTHLERGSKEYNALILKLWDEVLQIIENLGSYLVDNQVKLLYLVNVCSNPGNVSMALALVILSEFLGIPVINNNHDFYWEGGNRKEDIETRKLKKGPRDFFFTNAHIGEFFSIIEMIFPWESRSWINVNINKTQVDHLIRINGHNPANISEIGTAIDTELYSNIPKRQKINAYLQFEKILSRYQNALISYSVDDVIANNLVKKADPKPILIGAKTRTVSKFSSENIILLQPTRIISRKRIELCFKLINRFFKDKSFLDRMSNHPNLKLTLIISGPIAIGQYEYFNTLIRRFSLLLENIKPKFREKIFLACLFSELDKDSFKEQFDHPIGIPELYNISSLVLLPSKTEGRGLPILEATACGTPIICRRYEPKDVYREVIGEHLDEKDRLSVIGFDGKNIKTKHVKAIIDRIFFPNKYVDEVLNNRRALVKRYSLPALQNNLEEILSNLYTQLGSNEKSIAVTAQAFERYREIMDEDDSELEGLINLSTRQYLPGYGRLSFMLMLKSLIDPSFFRIEEQLVRGTIFHFAREIIRNDTHITALPGKQVIEYYNAVDNIFHFQRGEHSIRHDHSMSYRHRNKNDYPYQDYTIQELTGIINLLYNEILKPERKKAVDKSPHFFTDWNLALLQLTTSGVLAIDDREKLMEKMHRNLPIAYFPGDYLKYELEFFVLQSVRSRLNLSIEEELTESIIDKAHVEIAPVHVFAQDKAIIRQLNSAAILEYILDDRNNELKLLHSKGLLNVVSTEQLCVGIHFMQLGKEALRILKNIKDQGGYIISNRRNSVVMTDIVEMDRFHIGKVRSAMTANILGIPEDSGYIQYAPAGVRTTLAYPTPVQTARDFSMAMKSDSFQELCRERGEEEILRLMKEDAINRGTPILQFIQDLRGSAEQDSQTEFSFVNGVYQDGHPWNGVISHARNAGTKSKWKFASVSSEKEPRQVTAFAGEFETKSGKKARIAWNGGYILNPELVGKLGLPESYIGSPLGLIISGSIVHSPPLFNKAALMIHKKGKLSIRRINCSNGLTLVARKRTISFSADSYNNDRPKEGKSYYDLLDDRLEIPAEGRIFVRLAGNFIREVVRTNENEMFRIIPVGLTLAFEKDQFPQELEQLDQQVGVILPGLESVEHAIEAGPLLLRDGKESIDMVAEGWKTNNSIRTQAARLDYTDMRGPKIAAGLDQSGNLSVLAINGRIRESVGATHHDMAGIMKKFGIVQAMGFDPGGSSTLVVDGTVRNISPYNRAYETNVYSLPPEPRAVSNAVIGFIDN